MWYTGANKLPGPLALRIGARSPDGMVLTTESFLGTLRPLANPRPRRSCSHLQSLESRCRKSAALCFLDRYAIFCDNPLCRQSQSASFCYPTTEEVMSMDERSIKPGTVASPRLIG
jgi:hypothetical protein